MMNSQWEQWFQEATQKIAEVEQKLQTEQQPKPQGSEVVPPPMPMEKPMMEE